ncbi:DUF2721 domain-containing protein [Flavobacterium rhizosphaerae]|uniref:DUF2721 domain-containing protein n=1 Tax=Flavobacterium rhizosphaerae TaxID=3163298 RepID=A0ABW8YS15_9FLAO
MNLSPETPALLFSATSLILLAYTNRFLTIASIVRGLKKNYEENQTKSILVEIKNLNLRLTLIRHMQMYGVLSLFFSVFSLTLMFLDINNWGAYLFMASLFLMLVSLALSFWEISISVKALRVHLSDMIEETKNLTRNQ